MVQAGAGIKQVLSFQIFDRWGNLVFEQTNFPPNVVEHAWDGLYQNQTLSSDLFLYVVHLELPEGSSFFSGEVLLVR